MIGFGRIARVLPVMILLLSGLQALTAQAQPTLKFIDTHVHLIGGRGGNTDYDGAVKVAIEHRSTSASLPSARTVPKSTCIRSTLLPRVETIKTPSASEIK